MAELILPVFGLLGLTPLAMYFIDGYHTNDKTFGFRYIAIFIGVLVVALGLLKAFGMWFVVSVPFLLIGMIAFAKLSRKK